MSTARQDALLDGGALRVRIVVQGRYCHTAELRQLGRRVDGCKHAHPARDRAIACARDRWPGVPLEEA